MTKQAQKQNEIQFPLRVLCVWDTLIMSAHPTPDQKLLHVLYVNPELTAINAQIRYLNDWDIVARAA